MAYDPQEMAATGEEPDDTAEETEAEGVPAGPEEGIGDDEALAKVKEHFQSWDTVTVDERERAMLRRDYYDGNQWSDEELAKLQRRNQPAIVFNRIAGKINYILGTEVDSRKDPRAYPRTPQHEGEADAATDALRYCADKDQAELKRSAVTEEVCVEGTGGVVFDVDENGDPVTEQVPWDRIWADPYSRKPDWSDAAFLGTIVWMNIDDAKALYPDSLDLLDLTCAQNAGTSNSTLDRPRWWDKTDNRIQILEEYYREVDPKTGKIEWYECKWVGAGFLEPPRLVRFRDESGRTWCPMWLRSAYVRRGNADTNERYSPVQNMMGPQDEVNHRRSKQVHQLHSTRFMYERGALQSPDEFQNELSKPDGAAEVMPGRLTKDRGVEVLPNIELSMAQAQLAAEAKAEIDNIGTGPIRQGPGAADSGRLFIAQQEAGALELKPLFDGLRAWTLGVFRRYWWIVRQFWTEERWCLVRDSDDDAGYRFVGFNRDMTRGERLTELLEYEADFANAVRSVFGPNTRKVMQGATQAVNAQVQQVMQQAAQMGQQVPPPSPEQLQPMIQQAVMASPYAQEKFRANDVSKLDIDLVLDLTTHSALLEHEQFIEFAGLMEKGMFGMPPPADAMKLLIEMSAFSNKKRLLKLFDKAPDPAAQQMQQQQQQLALAQLKATVAQLQAESAKATAQAQLAQQQAAAVPASAQLDQAQAALAVAKAQAVPHEAQLKQAQAVHTSVLAGRESVPEPAPPQSDMGMMGPGR